MLPSASRRAKPHFSALPRQHAGTIPPLPPAPPHTHTLINSTPTPLPRPAPSLALPAPPPQVAVLCQGRGGQQRPAAQREPRDPAGEPHRARHPQAAGAQGHRDDGRAGQKGGGQPGPGLGRRLGWRLPPSGTCTTACPSREKEPQPCHAARALLRRCGRRPSHTTCSWIPPPPQHTHTSHRPQGGEDYKTFWESFGKFIRFGVVEDTENRDRLSKLLRFPSSASDTELTALQVRARMQCGICTGGTKGAVEPGPGPGPGPAPHLCHALLAGPRRLRKSGPGGRREQSAGSVTPVLLPPASPSPC
jgi:hypothetical protein